MSRWSISSRRPIVRITEHGIETTEGVAGVRHHRLGDRLRLRHRRAHPDGGPGPRRSHARATTGPTGRPPSSASRPPASRTSSSPVGLTPRPATTRVTTATRWTSSSTRWSTCATTGTARSRSTPAAEDRWTTMVDIGAASLALRGEQLLLRNQHPRKAAPVSPELGWSPETASRRSREVYDTDYEAFILERSPAPAGATV